MVPALMVLGTASDVGKSWVTTALCRWLARRGLRVRPFKAQNMSNNAAVADGGEIGRAQWVQAEACGVRPDVHMNPILLKPTGPMGSQVVLQGKALGHQRARDYFTRNSQLWDSVAESYALTAAQADVVVLEGAGSAAELNLAKRDLVNLRMAQHADAACWLVGDIERGGIFASLIGTVQLLPERDRARIHGLLVNRFRGDASLFQDGRQLLEQHSDKPVLGVLPVLRDIEIDAEDSLQLADSAREVLDIAAIRWPQVANFTDLDALRRQPHTGVRWVDRPERLGNPDLIVLPGSKDTIASRRWLTERGFDPVLHAAARRELPILGLCGGFQVLGQELVDDHGVAGTADRIAGLGLLPVRTGFGSDKRVCEAHGTTTGAWLVPPGLPIAGYEIHQGLTDAVSPLLSLSDGPDGCVSGLVAGTYVHGWLDTPATARALVDALRERRGLPPLDDVLEDRAASREAAYDALADHLDAHVDMERALPRSILDLLG